MKIRLVSKDCSYDKKTSHQNKRKYRGLYNNIWNDKEVYIYEPNLKLQTNRKETCEVLQKDCSKKKENLLQQIFKGFTFNEPKFETDRDVYRNINGSKNFH